MDGALATPATVHHTPDPFLKSPSRWRANISRSLRSLSNNQAFAASRLHLIASPSHLAATTKVASQGSRLRHLPTLYCTEWPSQAEQPATVRCKPSRSTMPLPQTTSSDAVPHRTDRRQATPPVTVRCKQPTSNHAPTPSCRQDPDRLHTGSELSTPAEAAMDNGPAMPQTELGL